MLGQSRTIGTHTVTLRRVDNVNIVDVYNGQKKDEFYSDEFLDPTVAMEYYKNICKRMELEKLLGI